MAAKIKREEMEMILWQLPMLKIDKRINITFQAYVKNARKDPDNIYVMFCKFFLDSLVKKGIIENDGQKQIGDILLKAPIIGEEKFVITLS